MCCLFPILIQYKRLSFRGIWMIIKSIVVLLWIRPKLFRVFVIRIIANWLNVSLHIRLLHWWGHKFLFVTLFREMIKTILHVHFSKKNTQFNTCVYLVIESSYFERFGLLMACNVVCMYSALARYENLFAHIVAVMKQHLWKKIFIVYINAFLLYSFSTILIFFLNSTPYSTSNAQLAEEPYWNIRITLTEIMHNALNFKSTV